MPLQLFRSAFLNHEAIGTTLIANLERQRPPPYRCRAKIELSRQRPQTIGIIAPRVWGDGEIAHTVEDETFAVFLIALRNMRVVPMHDGSAGIDEGTTELADEWRGPGGILDAGMDGHNNGIHDFL